MRRACFTGHRTYKLTRPEREIERDLETAIRQAVAEGYKTFITGMAYGVDLWVGEIVVRLRGENDGIRLIAAVPFPGFEARWPAAQQREYHDLLRQADLVRYISKAYYGGAYQRQNEWMVNHASRVIAVYDGQPGGTRNTIKYAYRHKVSVVFPIGNISPG